LTKNFKEDAMDILLWLGTFLLIVVDFICLPYLIKEMAKRDFFFTVVEEGTAKAIVGSGGGFQKVVYQYEGYIINDPTNLQNYNNEYDDWEVLREKDKTEDKADWFIEKLGLKGVKWIGLPGLHKVYRYKFRWNSLRQYKTPKVIDAGGGIYYEPHEEVLDYVLLQPDVYYVRVENAEDIGMVPLNLDIILRIRVSNPYKALFRVQEWLEMVWGKYLTAIRLYVAHQSWEELNRRLDEKSQEMQDRMKKEEDFIHKEYGVRVEEFRFIRISPAGTRASMYEEAATKQFMAEKEAQRILTLADAEAKKILTVTEAEKERIRRIYNQIKEFGGFGEKIRAFEALEKAANKGTVIVSAPELAAFSEVYRRLVSKRGGEG